MSWQDARAVAVSTAEKIELAADLKGKTLQCPDFDSDPDCLYFYPDRSLGFHRMILAAMKKLAWKRGTHSIVYRVLRKEPVLEALSQQARTDFADRMFRSLPI